MSKKVLMYRSRLLAISETFILDQISKLKRYHPIVAGMYDKGGLPTNQFDRILLSEDGRPSSLSIGLFKSIGYAPAFFQRIKAAKPDIIHAHFAVDAADMLPVAKELGVPLVVTLYGYDVTFTDKSFRKMGPEGLIYLQKRQNLFSKADKFVAISEFIGDQGRQFGAPNEKISLNYLGVDLDKFPSPEVSRENVVLYVGRLVEKKGLNLLIEAMERAGANETGTVLRVIGDGPKKDDFLSMAEKKLKNFEYLGAQSHERVIEEMGKASIFSMPSIRGASGDQEGLGVTYIEASAMKLPIAAFSFAGTKEAVKHGETGLLAPVEDIDALAANLRLLIDDSELRIRLGTQGRKYVEDIFDQNKCAQGLENIYDEVLG